MGEAKRRGTKEERIQQGIERIRLENEAKEMRRQLRETKEREEKRLNYDRERSIIQYLEENGLEMEKGKAYILDAIGEEVVILRGYDNTDKWYHVTFGKGREKIIYSVIKDDDGDIIVEEVKGTRKSQNDINRRLSLSMVTAALAGSVL